MLMVLVSRCNFVEKNRSQCILVVQSLLTSYDAAAKEVNLEALQQAPFVLPWFAMPFE
jgi:hypothetical protein